MNLSLNRRQFFQTLIASLKSRYRGSLLGFVWVLMNPLLLYGAQGFAFHFILKLNIPNFFVFLLSGLLPWYFIAQSVDMGTGAFVNHSRILKSLPVHPLLFLLSTVADNLINILAVFAFLLLAAPFCGVQLHWHHILFFLPFLTCFIAVVGLTWILATMQIFYRDIRYISSFIMSISFYFTPVFYPENFVDAQFKWFLYLNPIRYFILPFRDLLSEQVRAEFVVHLGISFILAAMTLGIAAVYWRRRRYAAYFFL